MFTNYMRGRIRHLSQLANEAEINGSHEVKGSVKYDWLSTGASVLRAMAKEFGLAEFHVHKNPGGPAVSGEATLAGKWADGRGIWVCMGTPKLLGDTQAQFYYRATRDGWQDGPNNWATFQALADDPEAAVKEIARRVGAVAIRRG